MLRVCKPILSDPIFELHAFAEHLVCDIWCNSFGIDKVDKKYEAIISYNWVKKEIINIGEICEGLSPASLLKIKEAFAVNNDIEGICNGISPIYLNQLHRVVTDHMKPLFVKFYEELIERIKIGGDKLLFYNTLYKANRFKYCICCGYMPFDTGLLDRREAYDHYLPKSEYPFASVNFKNLIPLCHKCNSDRKKDKDPVENGRKAFYPYRANSIDIVVETTLKSGFMRSLYETFVNQVDEFNLEPPRIDDISIKVSSNEQEQVNTWDELFRITDRYSERTGQFSFSHLVKMKRRYYDERVKNVNWKFVDTLNYHISDYENDKYSDEKFLKIPFMHALKGQLTFLGVYE